MPQDKNLGITIHDFSPMNGDGSTVSVESMSTGDIEIAIDTPRGVLMYLRESTARSLHEALTDLFVDETLPKTQ